MILNLILDRLSSTPSTGHPDVLIPLEEAHLHSHSSRSNPSKSGRRNDDVEETEIDHLEAHEDMMGDDRPGVEAAELHERTGMLEPVPEYSIEGLRREVRMGCARREWDSYELKAKIINKAIQDIGMGRYNWQLFILCGFGWFSDNLWLQGVSLTLPSLSAEFGVSEKTVRYTTSSLFFGLCLGSFFWGIGSDMMGRRIAFNATLLITAFFGLLASVAPSWGWACAIFAALGFGVGGNLPVDGALFLEFLPDASSSLLTLLSVWWPIGQLVSSLLAWVFIAHWPADEGWRRFVAAIGVLTLLMFCIRFFAFRLLESPKFLLSKGRQAEAVAVVHGIAFCNGAKTWLTVEILNAVADEDGDSDGNDNDEDGDYHASVNGYMEPSPLAQGGQGQDISFQRRKYRPSGISVSKVVMNKLASFSTDRLRPLFRTRKLGLATGLVWFTWAMIGMGYPLFNAFLPQYLSHGSDGDDRSSSPPAVNGTIASALIGTFLISGRAENDGAAGGSGLTATAYRSYLITSMVGVPGSLLAAYSVDHPSPFLGRRGTLAISTLVSAVFLLLFVLMGRSEESQLAFSCVEAFAQNIMYGVLYAFTPEMFPAPVRGAGTGVASFLNRATGLLAPVVAATVPGDGTAIPVYLSAAFILLAFLGIIGIPIETRGRQRL